MKPWKCSEIGSLPANEEQLLLALQNLFKHRQIYMYIGPTLLCVNPCRPLVHFYTAELIQAYQRHNFLQLPPHVYGLAEYAYHGMREYLTDQCLVLTGESGSGKTETCKYAIQYLMSSRKGGEVRALREQIVTSNILLEAFGNAKTKLNDNSSRFGKFFDIEFNFKGDASGAQITQFLMEKSRVIRQPLGERNFHIFYQLLTGAEVQLLKNLKLQRNLNNYQLLKHSKCFQVNAIDDKKQFVITQACLDTLCFSDSKQAFLWHVIASVLKLGNLNFIPKAKIDGTEGCAITNEYELYEVGELLLIDVFALQAALTQRTVQTRHETLVSDLNTSEAIYAKDALCKALYNRLFTWLVNRVNDVIRTKRVGKRKTIGILDVYGFENFEKNGYEQFLVNYCNEKLQKLFIEYTLKQEQEIYIHESLNWTPIPFINSELSEIYEKSLFGLLNEESLQLSLNEHDLLHQLVDCAPRYLSCLSCIKRPVYAELLSSIPVNSSSSCSSSSPKVYSSSSTHTLFAVQHYSAIVTYSINDFQLKNADHLLSRDVCRVLFSSELYGLGDLFPEGNPTRTIIRRPISRCAQLFTAFDAILNVIQDERHLHFIHCIRPSTDPPCRLPPTNVGNTSQSTSSVASQASTDSSGRMTNEQPFLPLTPKKPYKGAVDWTCSSVNQPTHKPIVITIAMHSQYVLDQVRALQLGAYAAMQVQGYAYHMKYTYFVERYNLLLQEKDALLAHDSACTTLESCVPTPDSLLAHFCPYNCAQEDHVPVCVWPLHGALTSNSLLHRTCLLLWHLHIQPGQIRLGLSSIFIVQLNTLFRIEALRKTRLDQLASQIQRMWRLYIARRNFLNLRNSQIVIARNYLCWKRKCFLLHLARHLPSESPICHDWPIVPSSLLSISNYLRSLYHKWRCAKYRKQFNQVLRNMMREKVTASSLMRGRKISYARSVSHPFRGDYLRLRNNVHWKKTSENSNDTYVVFADIVNKVNCSTGKTSQKLLVLSTNSLLMLDHRTFEIKYRIPLEDIQRISLSPHADDFMIVHVKSSEASKRKAAFVLETEHVIEVVTKLFLITQNATNDCIDVQITSECEAIFGKDKVLVQFKCTSNELERNNFSTKIIRKAYRMEIWI